MVLVMTPARVQEKMDRQALQERIDDKQTLLHEEKNWMAKLILIDQIIALKHELWGESDGKTTHIDRRND